MLLSDRCIGEALASGELRVEPLPEPGRIQPASLELTLSEDWAQWAGAWNAVIRPGGDGDQNGWCGANRFRAESVEIKPQQFLLAATTEAVCLAPTLAARVEGKSSFGRCGLAIHATAGFIDPGFQGRVTLELFNFNAFPIELKAGMPICQLALFRLSSAAVRPYGHPELGSHYQHQNGATPPSWR